jgi:hypothetical protein
MKQIQQGVYITVRKIIFVFLCFFSLFYFFSCSGYEVLVINNSSYKVLFRLNHDHASEVELSPGQFFTDNSGYDISEYRSVPVPRVSYRKIDQGKDFLKFEFYDTPSTALMVINNLGIRVELRASGYIENEPLIIGPGGEIATGKIFTQKPDFSVSADGFPTTVQYLYDEAEGTMRVTIR